MFSKSGGEVGCNRNKSDYKAHNQLATELTALETYHQKKHQLSPAVCHETQMLDELIILFRHHAASSAAMPLSCRKNSKKIFSSLSLLSVLFLILFPSLFPISHCHLNWICSFLVCAIAKTLPTKKNLRDDSVNISKFRHFHLII